LDIVIVVRVSAKEIDYHTMDKALMHVAGIQRILEKGDREGHE
jgi:hypothetical protein